MILGVEIVTGDSQSYLVSLSVQPSLIDKNNVTQVGDSHLLKIMENCVVVVHLNLISPITVF